MRKRSGLEYKGFALIFVAIVHLHGSGTLAADSAHIGKSREVECAGLAVNATIVPTRTSYSPQEYVMVDINVKNASLSTIHVLEESSSGGAWVDKRHRRMVIAHYAYTAQRENDLRGGITLWEIFAPEFYRIEPGQERRLEINFGSGYESGSWTLEGAVSIFNELPKNLSSQDMNADELAKYDCVVRCEPVQITISRPEREKNHNK